MTLGAILNVSVLPPSSFFTAMVVASTFSTTPKTLMALLPCANAEPAKAAMTDAMMRALRMGVVSFESFRGRRIHAPRPSYHSSGSHAQGRPVTLAGSHYPLH